MRRMLVLPLGALCLAAFRQTAPPQGVAWLGRAIGVSRRLPLVLRRANGGTFAQKRSDAFIRCVEEYDPVSCADDPFVEGTPSTGFRGVTESIRPYHPNPEWMIFPEPGFERDQKIASMYTLATGLYKELNKCIRLDNEDGMRRHAGFIYEMRELLRFKTDLICKEGGRKCKPFTGVVLRGMDLPEKDCEGIAAEYKVGTEFTWPGFTACQTKEGGLWPFDGNLNFEIRCNVDPRNLGVSEVYAPVKIGRFLGDSNEILFPPHTRFKVIEDVEKKRVTENEVTRDVYSKVLEVVDLPTPWEIEKGRA